MSISSEDLIEFHPRLYHMAEAGTWPSIRERGLLSTSALLDLYRIEGEERRQIESSRRPECVTIEHDIYGPAVIRDQKPMSEKALRKCLRGMTPVQWYRLLNSKVFFWLTAERVARLLSARAYLVTYPRDRMRSLLVIFIFVRITVIPAALLIVVWFLLQLLNAGSVANVQTGGVAYLAHIGGCIFGAVTARWFEDPQRLAEQ